jgi:site-specific recombinase XerD
MKGEQRNYKSKKTNATWIIDESKCLSLCEVQKLRRICEQMKKSGIKQGKFNFIRSWFMIELGLNTGLRVSEMASLRHCDLLIDGARSSLVVVGKGNRKRAVWLSSGFKLILNYYLSVKQRFGYDISGEEYLLNNLQGKRISKRSLQESFKDLLTLAGLSSHYHIHCLRHTYTTFLLKASNYNYRFVQRQLGHASIRTTQIYASVLEDEGKRALNLLYKQYDTQND